MFVSVVIVNFNGVHLLERCLTALITQTFPSFEIILVDNASTDDSCAYIAENFPQVQLIRSEQNVGFAAGNNLGIRAARGDAIATLNTDTVVEPNYLTELAAPLSDPQVGACAPLMLEMEHSEIVDAAGLEIDRLGFAWNIGAGEPSAKFQIEGAVYGACAGAALYRRTMLDQIGLFDDAYFGFYEDADLAWRAHNAGWKTVFVPSARVLHQHGASFGKIAPRKTYLLARNRWWTSLKNFPMPSFAFYLPLIALLDAGSLVQAAGRGHLGPALRGRRDAWNTKSFFWHKRHTS